MVRKLLTALAVAAATVLTAGTASATVFIKDYNAAGVWNAYDDVNETYSMKFRDDGSQDGFWLVVSPGPNPKNHVNEYAILYGDRAANRITAYAYDGTNSENSYLTSQYLGTYDNVFSSGGTNSTMFSLDVSRINAAFSNPEWVGVQLGAEAGIWFHEASGTEFAYNDDGTLANFSFNAQQWLDMDAMDTLTGNCYTGNQAYFCQPPTTPNPVPAPGGLALILLALGGLAMRRRA